ncbi:uncharacterized protein LOC142346262 [Convolutriloba macropyga]|uniref:uncharacterized protein LOC142346262 n=1 Tax=Convolutriloba macropyga TaxID=536237 RepID=UPI003F526046
MLSLYAEECNCLEDTDNGYFKEKSTGKVENCWAYCLKYPDCFAFSFDDALKECKLMTRDQYGPSLNGTRIRICESDNLYSRKKTYLFKSYKEGKTYDCNYLKENNGIVLDGIYEGKIRGHTVDIFCRVVLVETPETYLALDSVSSTWSGGDFAKNPFLPTIIVYTGGLVRVRYDQCLINLDGLDKTYAAPLPLPIGDTEENYDFAGGIGGGGTCSSGVDGEATLDMRSTDFYWAANVAFEYKGEGPVSSEITTPPANPANDRQYLHYSGRGECAHGRPIYSSGGVSAEIDYQIPLVFKHR